MTLIKNLKKHLVNLPGWRTDRRIVVFESDDWGMVRMPSRRAYDGLLRHGIRVDKYYYDYLDCPENEGDLLALFNLLASHKDDNGRAPVFTFNVVLGNPDYPRIEADGFRQYHYEDFFSSYRTYNGEDLEPHWRAAIEERLIRPQFHAREHLNVSLWMDALQRADPETRIAFDHRFFGVRTATGSPHQRHYLAACHAISEEDLAAKIRIIESGLNRFEALFGFRSRTFIPCNYVWPTAMEAPLADLGIDVLQGQVGQNDPDPRQAGKKSARRHYTGQHNPHGQVYTVRNCMFEPASAPDQDWVDACLADIDKSFRWRKPAIVSTHRVNFVSGMQLANRDRGLAALDRLLREIKKRWPGVEYLASDELAQQLLGEA